MKGPLAGGTTGPNLSTECLRNETPAAARNTAQLGATSAPHRKKIECHLTRRDCFSTQTTAPEVQQQGCDLHPSETAPRGTNPMQRTPPPPPPHRSLAPVTVDGCSPVHPGHGKIHDGPTMLGRTILSLNRRGPREPPCLPASPALAPRSRSSPLASLSASDLSSFRLCAPSALASRCSPRALVKVYVLGYPRSSMASTASLPPPPAGRALPPQPPPTKREF